MPKKIRNGHRNKPGAIDGARRPTTTEDPSDTLPEKPTRVFDTETHEAERPRHGPLIVGIGASAGGLKAFQGFLEAMPPETGMVFVLVPHLDPKHESLMVDLLSKRTRMPLREAKQDTRVEPDHVYVIPPNKYMEIRHGHLYLVTPGDSSARGTAIDRFFESLAEDQQEMAVGIVLSGTGSHGTSGLKEIKMAGGMVMVQDPRTADYPQMPQSAIDAGLADYVLAPNDMGSALISYARSPYVNHFDPETKGDSLETDIGRIMAILRNRAHYDFRWYRKKMMFRRVRRRMGLHRIEDPSVYLDLLRQNPEELHALYKDMLIGVTGFFREPEAFQLLEEQVIPDLVASAGKAPVRVWVPGCATGEEVYSIAMLLIEAFHNVGKPESIKIFATDIDLDSIARARQGMYPESIAGDLSPERLKRYFAKMNGHYQVRREIRELVVFAPQNLISDAPFSKLDLISCRNLMIYLELPAQQRIVSLLHFALRDGGYLFLGASESVGRHSDLFQPISKRLRIFRKVGPSLHQAQPTRLPVLTTTYSPLVLEDPAAPHIALPEVMRRILLETYSPAAVLVNRNSEVLAFHGPTVNYLEFPSGEPSRDLFALLRSGLRTKVRVTLQKALRESTNVSANGHVRRSGKYQTCRIDVIPVQEPKEARGLFFISFQDHDGKSTETASPGILEVEESSLLTQLENDLKTTREDLQLTIEQLESANEELKSANEEMMSMNEELQSANEELETSREELQSLNEELTTVNNQLNEKVLELDAAYADLMNLMTSSEIAAIFLDREMRIRKFTAPSQKLVNVVSADIGRPLADLSLRFNDPTLLEDAPKVLDRLLVSEAEVVTEDGQVYIRRILPYRTRYNRIEGVTITFLEITERKKQEEMLTLAFSGLEDQVARRTAVLDMIRDVAVQANAADTVARILEVVIRRICDDQGYVAGFAYCAEKGEGNANANANADGDDDDFAVNVAWITDATRESDRLRNAVVTAALRPGLHLLRRALNRGEPQWTQDLSRDFPVAIADAATILHIQSAFAYPIITGREVVALLLFMGKSVEEPDPRTLELLSSMANQIVVVMDREKLRSEIKEMSAYDQVRLSQDLHDAVGQQLAGLSMSAEVISRHLAQSGSAEAPALAEVVDGLRDTLQQIRLLARGLAEIPVGPGALAIALEQLCANNRAILHSQIQCRADVDRTLDIQDPDVATHLYRIAQEAVHNAVSHSHGKHIVISLQQDARHIILSIQDDGIGLGKTTSGMGLRTIRHRARLIKAALDVRSEQGTQITVRVPKGDAS